MGLLLEDVPGALWQRSMIKYKAAPEMERIVVGIDPSVSDSEDAARCGIVAAGKGTRWCILRARRQVSTGQPRPLGT